LPLPSAFISVLSSQLIVTFSDLAEGFLWSDEAKKFVLTFLGADIGSSFFGSNELIYWSTAKFGISLFFKCFFVITGLSGRFTCIFFFINGLATLFPWVIFSKNFFSVSYNLNIDIKFFIIIYNISYIF
jgi:hypothetical protein